MKKKVRRIVWGALALAVVAAAAASMLAPLQADTVALIPQTATLTFTERGSYDYDTLFDIYPIVAGEVLEVRVKPGDRVKTGDVIAVLNASDYEHQAARLKSAVEGYNAQIFGLSLSDQQEDDAFAAQRADLENQLEIIEAEIANAESRTESLESQIETQEALVSQQQRIVRLARDQLELVEDFGDDGEIIQARMALTSAQSAYTQAQLALEQLREGITQKETLTNRKEGIERQLALLDERAAKSYSDGMRQYYAAQIEAAEDQINQMLGEAGRATIVAPAPGVVRSLPVENVNMISQQGVAATLGSDEIIEVYVSIRDIGSLKTGDPVELIRDNRLGDVTTAGTVTFIDDKAETKTSALGVEESKVRVLIKPADTAGLGVGYDLDVRFTVYEKTDAVMIPKTAAFEQDGQDMVWLANGGVLSLRTIKKGVETRDAFVVEEGLAAGDIVVKDADNTALKEGKRVAVG